MIVSPAFDPKQVPDLCDRRYGVGADGVIWSPTGGEMHIFNADGSEAEMCGNGLRALAYHLGQNTTIQTPAGPYQVRADGAIFMPTPSSHSIDGYTLIDSGVPHLIVENSWDPAPLRAKYNANITTFQNGRARTFERGVEGETHSCGTGALALAHHYTLTQVTFASGETLHFESAEGGFWMHGSITRPFTGQT